MSVFLGLLIWQQYRQWIWGGVSQTHFRRMFPSLRYEVITPNEGGWL